MFFGILLKYQETRLDGICVRVQEDAFRNERVALTGLQGTIRATKADDIKLFVVII